MDVAFKEKKESPQNCDPVLSGIRNIGPFSRAERAPLIRLPLVIVWSRWLIAESWVLR